MPKILKSMILQFLDAQATSNWINLTQFLKDSGYADLDEIRSALMQMENDKLLLFRPGSFHKKLGLHERINQDDYKNSSITLDNIPFLDAKITDEGSEKARKENAAAGRRKFTAQVNNDTLSEPPPQWRHSKREKKNAWDLDNSDKLKIIEVTEDSLLDIVGTSQGPFEPSELLRDEGIPLPNRAKLMATLMLLRNRGLVKSDSFGLKYSITWKGRMERLYRFKGWGAVAAVIGVVGLVIAYLAWVHPFSSGESTSKPARVDTVQRLQTIKPEHQHFDSTTVGKARRDSIQKGGAK